MRIRRPYNKKLSLKTSLTIWYMIILTVVLLIFSTLLYLNMQKKLYQEVKYFLQVEAQQLIDFDYSQRNLLKEIMLNMRERGVYIGIYNLLGERTWGDHQSNIIPEKIQPEKMSTVVENETENWTVITIPRTKDGKVVEWIRLGRSLEQEDQTLKNLLTILFIGVPFTLIVASLGGYFLSLKALNPIDYITRTAQKISHSNLSQRLEEREIDDEIGRLTHTLNLLFDRLDNAFEQQKQFVADASHELRTPISVIRAQAEEALDEPREKDEYIAALKVIKRQAEHMSRLIGKLLLLARSDSGQHRLIKERFNIGEVVEIVMEEMQKLAKQKKISMVKTIEKVEIFADQSKVTQLLLNLIGNAIQYTPEKGEIKITVTLNDGYVKIQIKDNGIGISKDEVDNIFKRFYRVDKARSRENGGTGLGLSISKWIATIHGGEISVVSEPTKGSTFTVLLPQNLS